MRNQPQFDVVVVGGGPAGAAAAITLRRFTDLRVVLLEASAYDQRWSGETVSPGIVPLLNYMGIRNALDNEEHITSFGVDATWGQSGTFGYESIFTVEGHGWCLDRSVFDATLAKAASDFGIKVLTQTRMTGSWPTDCGWRISTSCCGRPNQTITARFVIDASGHEATFARMQGARKRVEDPLLAGGLVLQHRLDSLSSHRMQLETTREGWWYSAVLSGNKELVVFMTDATTMRLRRITSPLAFLNIAREVARIKERIVDAEPVSAVSVRPAYSGVLNPVGGKHWIAIGDAAASFDPLSSMGLGHALYGGIQGARVTTSLLADKGSALEDYAEGVHRNYREYQEVRRKLYLREQRWAKEPFWSMRQQN